MVQLPILQTVQYKTLGQRGERKWVHVNTWCQTYALTNCQWMKAFFNDLVLTIRNTVCMVHVITYTNYDCFSKLFDILHVVCQYTAKCISSLQLYWNLYFLGWCMGRNHSIWVFMALLRMYGRKDIRYYRVGLMQSKWFGKSIIVKSHL